MGTYVYGDQTAKIDIVRHDARKFERVIHFGLDQTIAALKTGGKE